MKPLLAILLLIPLGHADEHWKPLFDGKDMNGWEHVGPGRFTIENGMLKTEGGMGLLVYTPQRFSNATIPAMEGADAEVPPTAILAPRAETTYAS